ncbi:T9SS type A sorting domain-containing protein [Cochleicola gelatinilyticus]|uniref:Secretion system C-terminal sorting domain-containing protein n=1 Tax=Cochleicola gelatinilyticus TaxID=1763537 RepID=A0A167HIR9_9FLAO|nr:T9SS type A sorting domain-containing protein [Cochleicola gelatinilyticus]OAB78654.1 hypothetical protein ULVI_08710 [Cochleicola gelatinilyticus]
MIKTTTLLVLILSLLGTQKALSQFETTGSDDFGRIFDLTYDTTVPNKIYAVTLGNHIVVSEDNGTSWDLLYSLLVGQGASIRDLRLTPDATGLSFAAYAPGSTNSAIMIYDIQSETIIKNFPLPNQSSFAYPTSYRFYEGSTDVLLLDTNFPQGVSTEGKTYYTANGGDQWNEIYYTNNYDTVFINDVAINPADPNTLYLSRGNGSTDVDGGLFISNDAGQTWTETLEGIILDPITFNPEDAQHFWVGTGISFGATEENLYVSEDGGSTFSTADISWTEGILNSINVITYNEANPSQLIVLEENEIAISEDGGTTWQNIVYPDENPESYYYGLNASYNPQNSEEILISANYIPLVSSDGGVTLSWLKSPYFVSTGTMDLFRNETETHLYYGVQFGFVHRDVSTGVDTPYDIVPLNIFSNNPGQTQYADKQTAGRVYTFTSSFLGSNLMLSNDHGATKIQLENIFTNFFTAVASFPESPDKILTAFAGFQPSETKLQHIDFSDVNNIVITDLVLPELDIINAISIDGSGKIVLPIGISVYTSEDEGATWTNSSTGLEVLTANDLIFDIQRDPLNSSNYALASSKGIFISEDGGENWERKTTSLVYTVAFSTETEGAMAAATYSSQFSEYALHYSTDGGENWDTLTNTELLGIAANNTEFYFDETSVRAYIGSYDVGLVEYTIDLTTLNNEDFTNTEASFIMYPNPASDQVSIQLKNESIHTVTLFSVTGEKVMELRSINTLNISELAQGIYVVRVTTDSNKTYFKKLLVH